MEYPEKSKEKQLYNLLLKDLLKAGYKKEEIVIKEIRNGIYSVGTKLNIGTYCLENGKIILNTTLQRDFPNFNESLYLLGYREIETANGAYEMYNLKDIEIKTGKPKPGSQKVDIYSENYFKAWQNVGFIEDRVFLESLKLKGTEGKFLSIKPGELDSFIRDKTIRIKDIAKYYENGQLKQDDYIKYIKQTQNILLDQIGDERAEIYRDPITQKELLLYKKYNLIPESLYNQAKKKLEDFDKAKKNKAKTKKEIHSQTHTEANEVYSV